MNNLAENIGNFLSHTIYVHIYSSPNFLMETFINIVMIFIHCLLIAQVNAIIEEVNVSTKTYQIKKNLADMKSQRSPYKRVVRKHPHLDVNVVFKEDNLLKSDWSITEKISKILSTTVSEYLRSEQNSNVRNEKDDMRKIEPELQAYFDELKKRRKN